MAPLLSLFESYKSLDSISRDKLVLQRSRILFFIRCIHCTKMKHFFGKHFFNKCDQIRRKLWICSHLVIKILNGKLHFLCSDTWSILVLLMLVSYWCDTTIALTHLPLWSNIITQLWTNPCKIFISLEILLFIIISNGTTQLIAEKLFSDK